MTQSTSPKYLKLETNRPQIIALKYPTGKECDGFSGKQLRWILMDGRSLYTPVSFGPKVEALKIKAGERFQIEKRQVQDRTDWIPSRLQQQPAARIVEQAEALDEPQGIPPSSPLAGAVAIRRIPSTQLAAALKDAVTAAAEAEAHSKSIGYVVRFSPSDIRAMAISVLIGMQQGGRYAA